VITSATLLALSVAVLVLAALDWRLHRRVQHLEASSVVLLIVTTAERDDAVVLQRKISALYAPLPDHEGA